MTNEEKLRQDRIERFAVGYVIGHDDVRNMDVYEYMSRIRNVKTEVEQYLNGNNGM